MVPPAHPTHHLPSNLQPVPSEVPPRRGGKSPSNRPRPASNRKGKQAAFAARKRQQRMIALGAIVVVVAVVAVLIGIKVGGGGSSAKGGGRTLASVTVVNEVTGLSPQTMAGAAANLKIGAYPKPTGGDPVLTAGGKPEVLYIGAEFCPYCAGERWALVAALSKFGTFSNLGHVTSEANDTVASVPTFTFYGSTYSSPYLTFTPVETTTVSGAKLQTPTAAQQALFTKHDPTTGIPFLDLGGKWYSQGASYDDSALQHQKFETVGTQVGQQSTRTAGLIAATGGVFTSYLCQLTGGKSLGNTCAAFPKLISG